MAFVRFSAPLWRSLSWYALCYSFFIKSLDKSLRVGGLNLRVILKGVSGMSSVLALFFSVATGYVAAGLIQSFYKLLTGRPLSFSILQANLGRALLATPSLIFAGPAIVMRNAIRARLIEKRPSHWLALSTALSTAWSFVIGLFLLNVLVAVNLLG